MGVKRGFGHRLGDTNHKTTPLVVRRLIRRRSRIPKSLSRRKSLSVKSDPGAMAAAAANKSCVTGAVDGCQVRIIQLVQGRFDLGRSFLRQWEEFRRRAVIRRAVLNGPPSVPKIALVIIFQRRRRPQPADAKDEGARHDPRRGRPARRHGAQKPGAADPPHSLHTPPDSKRQTSGSERVEGQD